MSGQQPRKVHFDQPFTPNTAQTIAASAHIPGKELAKTVIVKIDDHPAMAVLPASSRVHMSHLKEAVAADQVELATEGEYEEIFPDCERGVMPAGGARVRQSSQVRQK